MKRCSYHVVTIHFSKLHFCYAQWRLHLPTELICFLWTKLNFFIFTRLTEVSSFDRCHWNLSVKCTYALRHPSPRAQLKLLMMAISLQPRLAHVQGKMLVTQSSYLLIFLWFCVLFTYFTRIALSITRFWSLLIHILPQIGGKKTWPLAPKLLHFQ